jgi:hypothetical protein
MKTQEVVTPLPNIQTKVEVELAFGVVKVSKDLWAIKIVKYQGNKILDIRIGNGTTMGHAITEAEDLLANFNLYKGDSFTAESYFETVRTI